MPKTIYTTKKRRLSLAVYASRPSHCLTPKTANESPRRMYKLRPCTLRYARVYTPVNVNRCMLCGVIKSCEVLKRKTGVNNAHSICLKTTPMKDIYPPAWFSSAKVQHFFYICKYKCEKIEIFSHFAKVRILLNSCNR